MVTPNPQGPMMSDCPEQDFRDALSEEEFWVYVNEGLLSAMGHEEDYWYPEAEPPDLDDTDHYFSEPCRVCRSTTACGYDHEGRPWIHVDQSA
jgi:hypothetical protein